MKTNLSVSCVSWSRCYLMAILLIVMEVPLTQAQPKATTPQKTAKTTPVASKTAVPQTKSIYLFGKAINPPPQGKITVREILKNGKGPLINFSLKPDNTYRQKITMAHPGYYEVNFFDILPFNVILSDTDVEINVDHNNPTPQNRIQIKGSRDMDLISRATEISSKRTNSPAMAALIEEYKKAQEQRDQAKIEEIQMKANAFYEQDMKALIQYLEAQPVSLGLLSLLSEGGLIMEKEKYFSLYKKASEQSMKAFPTAYQTQDFFSYVKNMEKTMVGRAAPEIALPNPEGKVIKLSSLRGKYVLIDFWAQWCGPCRQENPNVVKAYHRFKDKGFEVFGVSLDRDKNKWMQAIQEDGLAWTQVSDLKYFNSVAAREYNVEGIPHSILLDPKGVIVAKNLRGAELEKKLSEVLGN